MDVKMKIKWPNDVYAVDTKTNSASKIAGSISTASMSDMNQARCLLGTRVILFIDWRFITLGIGINVGNQYPTACLYEIMQRYCANIKKEMPSIATVIGKTIRHLENLIIQLERGNMDGIKGLYVSHWMHR